MKRFLQITSSSNDNSNISTAIVRRKIVDGDGSVTSTSSGAVKDIPLPVKVAHCTMRESKLTEQQYVSLLGEDDLRFADCCLLDQWMGNDKIMYRFHSANKYMSQRSSIDEDSTATANADKYDEYDVIAFDMDSTIIKTKSGKSFPIDDDDWTLLHASIKDTMQSLHRQHKYLAIISNQGGVKQQKISREGLQRKVDRIVEHLGINTCSARVNNLSKQVDGVANTLLYHVVVVVVTRSAHRLHLLHRQRCVPQAMHRYVLYPHHCRASFLHL